MYDIATKNKHRIIVHFEKRNNVLPLINGNGRQMINSNFIMIWNDMQINIDYMKITKTNKLYWNNILRLISQKDAI